jgi:Autotransporter beta-domain
VRRAAAAAALLLAGRAAAQTMLDQEQRLIQIHSLLVDLPAVSAPAPYREGQLAAGLEIVGIPTIDGTTGGKVQITASDRTRAFPRPRLALGLPAPEGFRAWAGAAYIPPVEIRGVSSHLGAAEGGIAWAPGPLALGLRAHLLYARSQSPVTDPSTRDTLKTFEYGAGLSGGYDLAWGPVSATPYATLGVSRLDSDFRVTSDGVVLSSRYTALALGAGVRLWLRPFEAVAELSAYPGRLVHPSFRASYVFDWGAGR